MKTIAIVIASFLSLTGFAQHNSLTIQQAIDAALKTNAGIQAAAYEVEYQKQLKKTSVDLPKTSISLLYGQYNSYAKNDNNITVLQTIPFTAFGSQGSLNRSMTASAELKKAATENELIYQVKQTYYQLAFVQARHHLLLQQDSIFEGFLKSASLRFKTGETNQLEQATAEVQRNDIKDQLRQNEADIMVFRTQLKTLLNSESLPSIPEKTLIELQFKESPDTVTLTANPLLAYMRQQVEVASSHKKVEAAKFAPDLLVGFFTQTLIGAINIENSTTATSSDRFTGVQVGISIPLWFVPHQARVKAAEFDRLAAQSNHESHLINLRGQLQQAVQQYTKLRGSLEYYHTSALPNAALILKQSLSAFQSGEIGYAEYLSGIRNAITIKEKYLQTLSDYNQSIIYIEYLSGIK